MILQQNIKPILFKKLMLILISFLGNSLLAQVQNNEILFIRDNSSVYLSSNTYYFGAGIAQTKTSRTASTYGKLIFSPTATWSGASSSHFVDGYASTNGATAFIFPIGQSGVYAPAGVVPSSSAGVDGAYFRANPNTIGATLDANVKAISSIEYWDIRGAVANAKISLTWRASSDITNLTLFEGTTISSLSNLALLGYDGTKWVLIPSTVDTTSILGGISTSSDGSITSDASINLNAYSAFSLGSRQSTSNTTTISACDSYVWLVDGNTYTTSGNYSVATGSHIEKLDLTITPSSDNVTTVSACDSYTWNGTTYTTSGIKTVPTANCVTEKLDLTITPSSDNVTTVSACDSYTWNGTTYTTSGIKIGLTTNCVTEKLDLTITTSSDNVTTVSACDSYFWNGTTYTTSGIKTGPTVNCVTEKLDLTITTSSDNVTTVSACDSYFWNGTTYTTSGIKTGPTTNCVTEKLDLTITPSSDNVTTVSACDSYTWNGTTYTTSGIKMGPTANCVTEKLDLTITASPIATVSQITLPGDSAKLSADQIGASYQWIDCNNANTPIPGEINQSFTPTVVGTYSVIVTLGTCSVTSDCIVVSTLKTDSFDVNAFNFYPNPVKDNLNLSYSKEITSVKVFNMIGQTLLDKSINATTANIEMSSLPTGTYFVEVKSLDSHKIIKVIKK